MDDDLISDLERFLSPPQIARNIMQDKSEDRFVVSKIL